LTCVSIWVRLGRVALLNAVLGWLRRRRRRHWHRPRRELTSRHRRLLLWNPLVARWWDANVLLLNSRLLRQIQRRRVKPLLGLGGERRLHCRFSMVDVRFGCRRGRLVVRQIGRLLRLTMQYRLSGGSLRGLAGCCTSCGHHCWL
jgi:hypothetical protein